MGDIIHTLPAVAALRLAFRTPPWDAYRRTLGRTALHAALSAIRTPSPQRPLVDRVHSVNLKEWRRAIFSFNTWQQMAWAERFARNPIRRGD